MMNPAEISIKAHRQAIAVFFFIIGLNFASWASRIPDIKSKLYLNDASLGAVLIALPLGAMLSLPLSGFLVAKYGSKKMVILGTIGYPIILIFIGFSGTIGQLITVLFLFGVLGNLCNISINTQAVGVEKLFGRSIMASFHGVWSLAGFLGAAIGTYLISQNLSALIHFCFIGSGSIILVIIFSRFAIEKDRVHANQPLFAKPDTLLLKLGLIAFSCMACEGTMFDWSGIYFQKVVKVPKEYTTLGYTAFMGTMAGGRFMGDWVVIKFGKQKVLMVSGMLIASGLLLAVLIPSILPATFGFLLVGFGVSSVVPLVFSSAGKSKTISPGMALTAVSSIGFLGFLLGPPMIGFISQTCSLRWSFTLIAIFGFLTTLLATMIKWKD